MGSLKTTHILLFVLTAALVAPALTTAATAHQNDRILQTLTLATVSYETEDTAKVLNYVFKGIQLFCLLLMIIDSISRFAGSPLRWMAVAHFIVFTFGASCTWTVGSQYPNAYRGYNENFLVRYYDSMYNSYFGAGFISIFKNLEAEGSGGEYPGYWNFFNNLFVELCIYFLLTILTLAVMGGISKKAPFPNLIGTLKLVFAFFLAMPIAIWATLWFRQHHAISKINRGDSGTEYKRWKVHFIVGWVVAILACLFIFIDVVAGTFVGALSHKASLSRSATYAETGKNEDEAGQARTSFQHRPNNDASGNTNIHLKTGNHCSMADVKLELVFMHQDPNIAAKHPLGVFCTALFVNRWIWFGVAGWIFTKKPRTMYTIFVGVDLIMIIVSASSLPTFRNGAGILILIEEVLVFLWHASQMILFYDQGRVVDKGKDGMSKNWVWFFVVIVFGAYLVTILIEIILIFIAIFGKGGISGYDEENLNSEELRLDAASDNNLEKKVTQFNKLKSDINQNVNKESNKESNNVGQQQA